MNTGVPKQFLLLAGEPILMHAIRVFHRYDPGMTLFVVLPENQIAHWEELCSKHSFPVPHQLVKGGKTRFCSVRNGLEQVSNDGLVAIHDGVRPLVSIDTLKRTFEEAGRSGNAIPVIRMDESIRETGTSGSRNVVRENLRIVQTPQVFRKDLIKKAYREAGHEDFTDDATVLEAIGETIHLVEGNTENIKITRPSDLLCAESLLAHTVTKD